MVRTRPWYWLVLVGALAVGCASNYNASYRAKNPNWFSTFPDEGAGLHETLAGLYDRGNFEYRLSVSKLLVVRISDSRAVELTQEEITAALDRPPGGETYGIVATVDCRSEIDMRMYGGQKTAWLLLEEGELSAWDVFLFSFRCTVGNEFRPVPLERAAAEDALRAFRDANFPPSIGHPGQKYAKGVTYIELGRLEAAEAMLAEGDRTFDANSDVNTQFKRPSESVKTAGDAETAFKRQQLVESIRGVRSAREAGAAVR